MSNEIASLSLAMTVGEIVIAGMGIGFGNGGGMKGRNRDWKIKSNSFVIEGKEKEFSCMSKMNFIIWSYLDGPIKAEETNILLKTYTHRCEPPVREAWQSRFSRSKRGEMN